MTQTMKEEHLEESLVYSNDISQSKTLDAKQSVSSESHKPRSYIGTHVSPDIKIKFFLSDGKVQAEVSGVDELVSVELPEITGQYNPSSVITRMKQLLRNFHLRPIYQSQPMMKVCFESISYQQKTWKRLDNVLSLPDHSIWICRRNNTISYAYANTVITWNWTNNTSTLTSYQTAKITALAEDVSGDLVVGDEQGKLFMSDQILSTGKEASIVNIIHLSSILCLLKFDDGSENLFNIELRELILIPNVDMERCTKLDNGMLVTWDGNEIRILEYDPADNQYKELTTYQCTDIDNIQAIPNAKFLICHKDTKWTLWDTKTKTYTSMKDNDYVGLVSQLLNKGNFLFLDKETLVFQCYGKYSRPYLSFYRQPKDDPEKYYDADFAGKWSINSMILLSDGSIMFATRSTPSGIHVVARNGTIIFTNDQELLDNQNVDSLKELSDGSVAVEYSQHICVLKPQILNGTENVDYLIELYNLKLRHNPPDLELYSELAKLYIKRSTSSRELYQLYLSGLQAAVKSTHLYQARRFYENARQIKSICKEPCETFLSYVETTPYKQLTRRIHLDLFALTKNVVDLPNSLKNRRCKTRLLIGEGDFSFTRALIDKHKVTHPNLAKAIIATDLTATHLNKLTRFQQEEKKLLEERIVDLQRCGVNVFFDVDAEQIHQKFKGRRFKRIQWNCPFGEATARDEFKKTIPRFFQSCSQLQLADDRVHITLMQKSDDYWKKRQKENPIVLGSTEAGYRLIRKRSFQTYGKVRYPEYNHVKTGTTEKYSSGGEEQEFIFEKTDKVFSQATFQQARELMDPHKKKYDIKADNSDEPNPSLEECYFVCSTDEDSSDYYESDSGEEL